MKIARFRNERRIAYGVVDGDELAEIRGSIFTRFRITDIKNKLSDVKLLAPTDPLQIWCLGPNPIRNRSRSAAAVDQDVALGLEDPEPWLKGRNSLIGHGDFIIIPKDSSGDVHYEGETVAVIGKTCRRVGVKEALKYVLGYTCGNNVSERTWEKNDWTLWRAKGADTFAPVGPWIETDVDPGNLEMVVRRNGEVVQRTSTRDMVHDFPRIINYISQDVTLHPGDLIFSRTSGATSAMKPDDVMEVDIAGIGVLRNVVKAEE